MLRRFEKKDIETYSKLPFDIALFVFGICMMFLFYKQAIAATDTDWYCSDLPTHIKVALNGEGIGLLQIITRWLAYFSVSPVFTSAIALTACNLGSVLVLRKAFQKKFAVDTAKASYQIDFYAVALLLVSMLITFVPGETWYIGKGTPNPWHNSTYISCRFFALIVFFSFLQAYETSRNDFVNRNAYIKLSLWCILCIVAKPSFLMAFMPACFFVLVKKLFTTKGKSFWPSFWTGIAFLPALATMWWQTQIVFVQDTQADIIFAPFAVVLLNSSPFKILINFVLSCAFPIYMFFATWRKKPFYAQIGYATWICGVGIFYLLAETGSRFAHGNMGWSYMMGQCIAFVCGVMMLQEGVLSENKKKIGKVLFALHLACGIIYFVKILLGYVYF